MRAASQVPRWLSGIHTTWVNPAAVIARTTLSPVSMGGPVGLGAGGPSDGTVTDSASGASGRGCEPASSVLSFARVMTEIVIHPEVRSVQLPHPRPVSVWLPPGYEADTDRRYPVLYLHDGQN